MLAACVSCREIPWQSFASSEDLDWQLANGKPSAASKTKIFNTSLKKLGLCSNFSIIFSSSRMLIVYFPPVWPAFRCLFCNKIFVVGTFVSNSAASQSVEVGGRRTRRIETDDTETAMLPFTVYSVC